MGGGIFLWAKWGGGKGAIYFLVLIFIISFWVFCGKKRGGCYFSIIFWSWEGGFFFSYLYIISLVKTGGGGIFFSYISEGGIFLKLFLLFHFREYICDFLFSIFVLAYF